MKRAIIVNTDGGARGNPGPAAVGVVITDINKRKIVSFGKCIGVATNNTAEYQAVIEALLWIKNNLNHHELKKIFFLDSMLIVNQLNGVFKIKAKHLKELIMQAKASEQEIGGEVEYHFIPREQNSAADSLVNQALDSIASLHHFP